MTGSLLCMNDELKGCGLIYLFALPDVGECIRIEVSYPFQFNRTGKYDLKLKNLEKNNLADRIKHLHMK